MPNFRSPLNLALLAILVLATIAGYVVIPPDAQVPVRWGADLQPAMTMPKLQGLLQMLIATAAVWAIFWAIQRYGNRDRHAGQARALSIGLTLITALLAAVQIAIVVVAR